MLTAKSLHPLGAVLLLCSQCAASLHDERDTQDRSDASRHESIGHEPRARGVGYYCKVRGGRCVAGGLCKTIPMKHNCNQKGGPKRICCAKLKKRCPVKITRRCSEDGGFCVKKIRACALGQIVRTCKCRGNKPGYCCVPVPSTTTPATTSSSTSSTISTISSTTTTITISTITTTSTTTTASTITTTTTTSTATTSIIVPAGFEVFNGRVIRPTIYSDTQSDWDGAMSFCDKFGAIPFIPLTVADAQLYKTVNIALGSWVNMWLPAYDRAEEGTLRWYNEEVVSNSSLWYWFEGKDIAGNKDLYNCLSAKYGGDDPVVFMATCGTGKWPPICEKI